MGGKIEIAEWFIWTPGDAEARWIALLGESVYAAVRTAIRRRRRVRGYRIGLCYVKRYGSAGAPRLGARCKVFA